MLSQQFITSGVFILTVGPSSKAGSVFMFATNSVDSVKIVFSLVNTPATVVMKEVMLDLVSEHHTVK